MSDDLDLAMRARMAEADAELFRSALIWALGYKGRPSDSTIIAFATEAIQHSRRFSSDNPLGRSDGDPVRSTDEAVAVVRATAAELRAMRTDQGYRLALYMDDVVDFVAGTDAMGGNQEGPR